MRNTVIAFLLLTSLAFSSVIEVAEAAKKTKNEKDTATASGKKSSKSTKKKSSTSSSSTPSTTMETNEGGSNTSSSGAKDPKKPSAAFEKNIENHMPDPSDPTIAGQLRCSACAAVVHELYTNFTAINKKALAKGYPSAKDYEFVDAMEEICKNINKDWGLEVDGDRVTTDFRPKTVAKYQIRSGWVASYIRDRCAEITDKHEQHLFRLGKNPKRTEVEWTELICVMLDKSCAQVVDKEQEERDRQAVEEEKEL